MSFALYNSNLLNTETRCATKRMQCILCMHYLPNQQRSAEEQEIPEGDLPVSFAELRSQIWWPLSMCVSFSHTEILLSWYCPRLSQKTNPNCFMYSNSEILITCFSFTQVTWYQVSVDILEIYRNSDIFPTGSLSENPLCCLLMLDHGVQ